MKDSKFIKISICLIKSLLTNTLSLLIIFYFI